MFFILIRRSDLSTSRGIVEIVEMEAIITYLFAFLLRMLYTDDETLQT